MTLQDVIDYLHDKAQEQTLTLKDIERCAILIYEMGVTDGRNTDPPPRGEPVGYTNVWLAEMGYATLLMVMKRQEPDQTLVAMLFPESLEKASIAYRDAWRAAAAAIRRRVVNWRMPAEETEIPTTEEPY